MDLLELFDLENGSHYFLGELPDKTKFYVVRLNSPETQMLYECIKDLNIYIPRLNLYIEDYIFLKIPPTQPIQNLINKLNMEQVFDPYLHNVKLYRLTKKYYKH